MVLGKLPVPGRPTIWMKIGQGPIALAVGKSLTDIFLKLDTNIKHIRRCAEIKYPYYIYRIMPLCKLRPP